MPNAHPPNPGPVVQPNFLAILEALGDVTFPISKRDLLEQVGDGTVVHDGRNIDLHALIKDIHDDHFDDEAELQSALERHYPGDGESSLPLAGTEGGVLPTGPQESWQSRMGPGDSGSAASYLEPSSE